MVLTVPTTPMKVAAAFDRPADGEEHIAAGDGYFHHRGQNIAFFQAGRGAAARDDDVSIVMAREDNSGESSQSTV